MHFKKIDQFLTNLYFFELFNIILQRTFSADINTYQCWKS